MVKIKIIEDVLSIDTANHIEEILMGNMFPWYFQKYKIKQDYNDQEILTDYQFTHLFYNDFSFTSPHIEIILPLIEYLDPSALVRIKSNLNLSTENPTVYGFHKDFENFDGLTALYYVNDNNGQTLFESGERIDSVKNRLVIFPANLNHTGISCTDEKARCVINFNYYNWNLR